jgi:hypothetical protein
VGFAAITLYVASQRVFIVVSVYFVIDSVRKLLGKPSSLSFVTNSPYRKSVPNKILHFNEVYITYVIAQSVLRWARGWTIGVLGFDSRRRMGIFLFTTASRTALGPTEPPIQWVPGPLSLEVKRPGREADNSPPSSAEVKNAWSYTSTPPIRLHGVLLS